MRYLRIDDDAGRLRDHLWNDLRQRIAEEKNPPIKLDRHATIMVSGNRPKLIREEEIEVPEELV